MKINDELHWFSLPMLSSVHKTFCYIEQTFMLDIDFTMSNLYIVTLITGLFHELDNRGYKTMYK